MATRLAKPDLAKRLAYHHSMRITDSPTARSESSSGRGIGRMPNGIATSMGCGWKVRLMKSLTNKIYGQVWRQVGRQVWRQVDEQVWWQVNMQVDEQVRLQAYEQVWRQVWMRVYQKPN
jgi:hypothetical protein